MNSDDKFFNYDALNLLDDDIDNMSSFINDNSFIEKFIIVPFKINFNCTCPFNTILLINNFTDVLCFPSIDISCYDSELNNSTKILSRIHCYLYSIFLSNSNSGLSNNGFEIFLNLIEFKGFYVYENQIYAFVDLTKLDINTNIVNRNSLYWFVLLDEIVNKQSVCNIPISEEVVDFYMNNNEFIYFKNSKEELIEVPSVVYTGSHEKTLHFKYTFGNSATDNNGIVSSGFYFTNYIHAFRQGGWSLDYKPEFKYGEKITEDDNGKYSKGGIIRYALFLDKNLVKQNLPNDIIDESDIKKVKLQDACNNGDYNYEKMTLRISDHDGLWKQNYDSVYLGKIELDNGDICKNANIYVIKDYYNHTPLSYHYINKFTLGDTFDENSDYQIM
jgi:hypothetical protein